MDIMFYDICIKTDDSKETIGIAGKLGLDGIGLVIEPREMERYRKIVKDIKNFDIVLGAEITAKNPSQVGSAAKKIRKEAELILVSGGDLEVNRTALETPEVDVLLSPWSGRSDCGINHIMARLARKNNVAIGFDFNELLYSYKKTRTGLLSNLMEAAKLVKKFRAPFVITSGAKSPWDLRSFSELLSFGRIMGFQDPGIREALSEKIVKDNRKRLSKKWIMPGVEIE